MKILFIADVVGKPGRRVVKALLPALRREFEFHVVVANGENLAGGYGVTPTSLKTLFDSGVDVVTTGNHIWDRPDGVALLDEEPRLLRPANYPAGNPGSGSHLLPVADTKVAVVNLQGRVFMSPIDDPFRMGRALIEELRSEASIIVIDFHAEATAEKQSFAHHVDGLATAVIGTHTHVPTADERILPGGTACVTDIGMTGSHAGVIGYTVDKALQRAMLGRRTRFELADGDLRLQGAIVDAEVSSGQAVAIERIERLYGEE